MFELKSLPRPGIRGKILSPIWELCLASALETTEVEVMKICPAALDDAVVDFEIPPVSVANPASGASSFVLVLN